MRKRFFGRVIAVAIAMTLLALLPASAVAQAPTSGGQTWNPPRTPDGQPDIQGFWANQGRRLATYNIESMEGASETHTLISGVQSDAQSLIVDPVDGRIPYQPWARAKRQEIFDNHNNLTKWEYIDPHTLCYLSGIPRIFYQGGFQILQPAGYVVFLQEFNHGSRVIPLDGRPHVGENIKLWMGDSRGHWEGNTLVVDVTNKNDKTRLDIVGDFHGDAVHIVERYTPVTPDTIQYEATFHDPKVYMRPWRLALTFGRNTQEGFELMEEACHEGQESQQLIKTLRSIPR
jgi:hypothetical protein